MRSVSHPGTHHIVFQLNLRSHVYAPSSFWQAALVIGHFLRVIGHFLLSAFSLNCQLLLPTTYSLLKLFTGFAHAAFIAWKLTVNKVIISATMPARINTPGPMLMR